MVLGIKWVNKCLTADEIFITKSNMRKKGHFCFVSSGRGLYLTYYIEKNEIINKPIRKRRPTPFSSLQKEAILYSNYEHRI